MNQLPITLEHIAGQLDQLVPLVGKVDAIEHIAGKLDQLLPLVGKTDTLLSMVDKVDTLERTVSGLIPLTEKVGGLTEKVDLLMPLVGKVDALEQSVSKLTPLVGKVGSLMTLPDKVDALSDDLEALAVATSVGFERVDTALALKADKTDVVRFENRMDVIDSRMSDFSLVMDEMRDELAGFSSDVYDELSGRMLALEDSVRKA